MAKTNANHLVSTAKVFSENKYSEFTTFFRIPFKEGDIMDFMDKTICYKKIFAAWSDVFEHWKRVWIHVCLCSSGIAIVL